MRSCLVPILTLALSCTAVPADYEGATAPIVDGSLERQFPEVMFLFNFTSRSACTATLIAPRVVLTAKHCVQNGNNRSASPPSNFRLFTGATAERSRRQYAISEVIVAPGRWDLRDASDVALLVLPAPAEETPREVSFESPALLTGAMFTAIGYGQTPSGSSGTKMRVEKRVDGVANGFIYVRPSVCSGDSGGPLIGPDGKIYGVASYIYSETRSSPVCGTAPGAYNTIVGMRDLIETTIEESGGCVPSEETCNGADDNCDGRIDEGCSMLGEACASASECTSGECEMTEVGRICTQSCDPMRPSLGCTGNFFCENVGDCRGFCTPRADESLALGEECAQSAQCDSGFCAAIGEETKRCHAGCRDGAGQCLAGEVCFANADSCGACVDASAVDAMRSVGEPCSDDADCEGGTCFTEAGVSYCSQSCVDHEDCGEAFHCRESLCVRGPVQDLGGECLANGDCGSAFCALQGERGWCTDFCQGIDDCPLAFSCLPVGDQTVCVPANGLVGDACDGNEDCIDALCVSGTPRGAVCSNFCGAEVSCSAGFECVRVGGSGLCLRPPVVTEEDGESTTPPADEGGCSVSSGSPNGATHLPAWLAMVGTMLLWRRRF